VLRRIAVVAAAASVVVLWACTKDIPVQPSASKKRPQEPAPALGQACTWPGAWYQGPPLSPSEKEEEIFGHISSTSGPWSVSLAGRDAQSSNNQATTYWLTSVPVNFGQSCASGGPGHVNVDAEWGWYAFGPSFGQCVSLTDKTQNDPERHRLQGAAFPEDYERHCVNAGRFTLTLNSDGSPAFVRPIDFIAYAFAGTHLVENLDIPPGNGTVDVLVDIADGPGSAATPGLQMSAALNASDASWPLLSLQSGAYRVPSNFYVRFDPFTSVPATGVEDRQLLVRYFWNYQTDLTDRTGFVNVFQQGYSNIRVKKFAAGTRTVRMHVVQPYERPATPTDVDASNYGATLDLPFNVYGPLTAIYTPNPGSVLVRNALQFTAGGSDGAGSITYQWNLGDGGSSSVANPSYTYQTPGTQNVTFTKTDLYGNSVTTTGTVSVTDPAPTSLSASSVGSTTATITWTNGNTGSTTTIETRLTGTSTWYPAGTAAAGATSLPISNLTPCTWYDGKAYHVAASYSVNSLFHTNGGTVACAPVNFVLNNCYTQVINGQTYRYFNVSWTQTEFSFKARSQIGWAGTNDPAGATIIQNAVSPPFTSATLGPYSVNDNTPRYFWVRHTLINGAGPSTWTALADNPLRGSVAC